MERKQLKFILIIATVFLYAASIATFILGIANEGKGAWFILFTITLGFAILSTFVGIMSRFQSKSSSELSEAERNRILYFETRDAEIEPLDEDAAAIDPENPSLNESKEPEQEPAQESTQESEAE